MNKEVLKKIKESYERLEETQKEIKKVWNRINILEENPIVKEYLSLKESVKILNPEKLTLSKSEILEICSRNYLTSNKETNDIYICLGTVRLTVKKQAKFYKRYINLEAYDDNRIIPIEESKEFEKNHQIIEAVNFNEYVELQKDFILNSIEEGQEVACKKLLLKKNKEKL